MKDLLRELRISVTATLLLAVILCGVYPMIVWVLAQGLFPTRANGSLIVKSGKTLGSSLIGQGFTDPKYFHTRPSAAGQGYDAASSGGSNLGPLSRKLVDEVGKRITDYRTENDLAADERVPVDAVTASASGLDPHITVRNAVLQAKRVAKARGMGIEAVMRRIKTHTEERTFGILGEPRVNAVMLNLDLDGRL
jgi:potassium-transporting ATPase KdpC subunit